MRDDRARLVASCAAIVAVCVGFVVPAIVPVRVLWYYPLAHRWAYEVKPTGIAMDWYGRSAVALLVGGMAFVFAGRLVRSRPGLWIGLALVAMTITIATYVGQIAERPSFAAKRGACVDERAFESSSDPRE